MFRGAVLGFTLVLSSLGVCAQEGAAQPHFDQAAIRVADLHTQIGGAMTLGGEQPGVTSFRRIPLTDLVRWAYGVENYQVVTPLGGPSPLYDLDAVYPPDTPKDQVRRMAQAFLEEKLKLQVHREKRDMDVYTMSVAKGGPLMRKLQASTPDPDQVKSHWMSKTEMHFEGPMSAASLAHILAPLLDHPLIDNTGLTDRFFLGLTYPIDENTHLPDRAALAAAVEKQLGLKIEPVVLPMEMVVVDHVEPPPVEK